MLLHDAAAQLAVSQREAVAGVVEQGDVGRGRSLLVKVCVGRVGDQLVLEPLHEQVTLAHFGILPVEVGHLGRQRRPLSRARCLVDLDRDGLGQVVVELVDHGYGAIAPRLLEVAVVFHPLPVAMVERVVLLVQSVVEVAPGGILVLVAARRDIVDHHHLGFPHHFLSCRDVQRAVDDLAEHVNPGVVQAGEPSPVAARVSVDSGVVEDLEVFGRGEFRPVPHGAAVHAGLLQCRPDARCDGVFLAVVLPEQGIESAVPSAVVIPDAVVLGQSGDEGCDGDTLVVVEARGGGVLVKPQDGLRVFPAGVEQVLVALHHAIGVERVRPDVAAEADGEQSAILVSHGHELGKEGDAR